MSAVHAQVRNRRGGTTLALTAMSALAAVASWYATRDRLDLPPLPAAPSPTALYDRALFRPGDRAPRVQALLPSSFTTAFERGLAAYNADDPDAAVDAFEEAVRLAPDDPEAHINLGLVYLRLRRADDGLRELHEGARLEQRDARRPARSGRRDATISSGVRP